MIRMKIMDQMPKIQTKNPYQPAIKLKELPDLDARIGKTGPGGRSMKHKDYCEAMVARNSNKEI